jgi:hypothetical protein
LPASGGSVRSSAACCWRAACFTALDADPGQVDTVRKFGLKVFYGDAAHLDLLHAAQLDEAKVFVLAIDDVEASLRTAELVRRHFPHVQIVARARNRFHASRLMDLGIERQIREPCRPAWRWPAGPWSCCTSLPRWLSSW